MWGWGGVCGVCVCGCVGVCFPFITCKTIQTLYKKVTLSKVKLSYYLVMLVFTPYPKISVLRT